MKAKNSKFLLKVLAFVCAFVMVTLFLPLSGLYALAASGTNYVDYSYIRIGNERTEIVDSVYTGSTYSIPKAYIGADDTHVVGDDDQSTDLGGGVTLVSSDVIVSYGSVSEDFTDETTRVEVTPVEDANYIGTFEADRTGNYIITYMYTYSLSGGETYTNYYDLQVRSETSSATMELENNGQNVFPSIIDLSLLKDGSSYKNITLPIPTVYDEDGNEVEKINTVVDRKMVGSEGDVILVSVNGGVGADNINSGDNNYLVLEAGDVVIDGDVFADPNFGPSEDNFAGYTVRYSYYHDGQFITSVESSATVYYSYYSGYNQDNLSIATDESLTTTAQPGIEQELPGVIVTTNSNVTPSNEEVDVYYTVEVRYRAQSSTSWAQLDKTLYNKEGEDPVVNEDGTLVDPTVFTPLLAGDYTFIYTAYDLYGNSVFTNVGRYSWTNIQDTTAPEPFVYDASDLETDGTPTYEDASDKLKTNAYPNSVIVYAIGIDDNLSTSADSDLRRIVYSNSEEVFSINDYDEYNLVFNYRASTTSATDAYENLLTRNYLINKATGGTSVITTDAQMLDWLKENNYLIVIDNGNKNEIYRYFSSVFSSISSITNGDTLATWASDSANQDALIKLGFAFINTDRTFGANSSSGGFTQTSFQIRYWAKDAAGNSNYQPYTINLTSSEDSTAPEITFSTVLQDTYLSDAEVTFTLPTASDNQDNSSRMKVVTYYRFLDESGAPIDVSNDDDIVADKNVTEVFEDARAQESIDSNGILYADRYADWHTGSDDYYIELTAEDGATEYTIDLAIGVENDATSVQIFVFTYDDAGNVGILGREFAIANTLDTAAPTLRDVDMPEAVEEYKQGDDIELPTITVIDDNANNMSFNISVYYLEGNIRDTISSPTNSGRIDGGRYTYKVQGGTFSAPFAGDYVASIAISDSANNKIVVFTHYTTSSRIIVQDPVVEVDLQNETYEFDEYPVIEIPTPTVDYSLDNSMDYETYSDYLEDNYFTEHPEAEPDFVVIGVNENNYVTRDHYYTEYAQANSFTPERVGSYSFRYYVDITMYSTSMFTYHESTYSEVVGGALEDYFTLNDDTSGVYTKIRPINSDSFEVYTYNIESANASPYDASRNPTGYTGLYVVTNEDGVYTVTENGTASSELDSYSFDFEAWFENLRRYDLTTDIYTFTVEDTTGPVIDLGDNEDNGNGGPYPVSISAADVASRKYTLKILGISATDRSGIDYEESSVEIRTSYKADGTTLTSYDSLSQDELLTGKDKTITLNGTITITYEVYDLAGNSTSVDYVISAGDVTDPEIGLDEGVSEEDFIKSTYTMSEIQDNDNVFTIDISKLNITDNISTPENIDVTYELVNNDTGKEIEYDELIEGEQISYIIEEVGSYTFTVVATDENGRFSEREFSFTVEEGEYDASLVYQIIGTVLIVISVLLLAGVIIYFVVSKVKLDKELKK